MNLVKLLADAYPGETKIPETELRSVDAAHWHAKGDLENCDTFFTAILDSLVEAAWPNEFDTFEPAEQLAMARDVLQSYRSDVAALLAAVAAAQTPAAAPSYPGCSEIAPGVFFSAGDAIYIADEQGEVVTWNADEWAEDADAVTATISAVVLAVQEGPAAVRRSLEKHA